MAFTSQCIELRNLKITQTYL